MSTKCLFVIVMSVNSDIEMWVVEDIAQQITLAKQTAIVYLLSNANLTEHRQSVSQLDILLCLMLISTSKP